MPEVGSLLKWHCAKGAIVKAGDLLCEIETDKTVIEVQAEADGVVGQILLEAGTSGIAAGRPLARIDPQRSGHSTLTNGEHSPAAVETVSPNGTALGIDGRGRLAASPRARRLASEVGLNLAAIQGTGPGGRIVERDVLRTRNSGLPPAPFAKTTMTVTSSAEPILADNGAAPNDIENVSNWRTDMVPGTVPSTAGDIVELTGMRRTIAERLSEAKRSIPHFYLSIDIDMDALIALRERINREAVPAQDGTPRFKLSINDFVVKALALALIGIPQANSIWEDGKIRRLKTADVGIAVAIDDGLYTPVLREVESKALSALSRECKSLADRARERALLTHECQGGAATVSNLGMFGIDSFAAIINPPQSSVLAVGIARQQVVARAGQGVIANVMSATLSCDHRVIDGALGAKLLAEVKRLLEAPFSLIS
jgi:pyruvate dehydrogenase E2 component (dihydrolipoamide acetyltransferase)